MVKLKLKLVKFEKAIAVQILEQDERFIANNGVGLIYESKSGFKIRTENHCDLSNNTLWVKGYNTLADRYVGTRAFETNKERDEYIDRMFSALREWSEKWEGFQDSDVGNDSLDDDIFEF